MDLHGGAPWWLIQHELAPLSPPLTGAHRCQVLIIGAGITGALLADSLSSAGHDVIVVDRREPGMGSTAASTALLQYEIDIELNELVDLVGIPNAVRAYHLCLAAISRVGELAAEVGPVGFTTLPSLYLASKRGHAHRLRTESELRQRHGLPARWIEREEVAAEYGLPSHGAIASSLAGQVDPLLLTRRLLARTVARGGRVHGRTEVGRCDPTSRQITVELSGGSRVVADWVIYAGGYEVPEPLRAELVSLHSTFGLITEPVEGGRWNGRCLVWESARPYNYLRTADQGRVIIGGEDLPFRNAQVRDRLIPARTERLEHRLALLLPDVECRTAYSWAGTFGETDDGLPYIGPAAPDSRVLYALGYGGNGITFSVIAARILRDLVEGTRNDDAAIFALNRAG